MGDEAVNRRGLHAPHTTTHLKARRWSWSCKNIQTDTLIGWLADRFRFDLLWASWSGHDVTAERISVNIDKRERSFPVPRLFHLTARERGWAEVGRLPWVPEVSRSRRAGAKITGGGGLGSRLSESEKPLEPRVSAARNMRHLRPTVTSGHSTKNVGSRLLDFLPVEKDSSRLTEGSERPYARNFESSREGTKESKALLMSIDNTPTVRLSSRALFQLIFDQAD